jgi:hypothetical protein
VGILRLLLRVDHFLTQQKKSSALPDDYKHLKAAAKSDFNKNIHFLTQQKLIPPLYMADGP